MKRRLLSAAPMLAALFVVIGLALALGACGAAGDAKEEAKGRPLPKKPGALSFGQYHSVKFKPSLSFKVSKGWINSGVELPAFIQLGYEGFNLRLTFEHQGSLQTWHDECGGC